MNVGYPPSMIVLHGRKFMSLVKSQLPSEASDRNLPVALRSIFTLLMPLPQFMHLAKHLHYLHIANHMLMSFSIQIHFVT
jgi:hypothetical protein